MYQMYHHIDFSHRKSHDTTIPRAHHHTINYSHTSHLFFSTSSRILSNATGSWCCDMSTTDAELNEVVEEEGLAFMSGHSIGGGVGENSGSLSLPVSNAVGGVELSGRMGAANNEGKGRAGAGASSSVSSFFSFNWLGLQTLQKYFDVDTEEVSLRLKAALVRPYARDFLHARLGAERSGDLYGASHTRIVWMRARSIRNCITLRIRKMCVFPPALPNIMPDMLIYVYVYHLVL